MHPTTWKLVGDVLAATIEQRAGFYAPRMGTLTCVTLIKIRWRLHSSKTIWKSRAIFFMETCNTKRNNIKWQTAAVIQSCMTHWLDILKVSLYCFTFFFLIFVFLFSAENCFLKKLPWTISSWRNCRDTNHDVYTQEKAPPRRKPSAIKETMCKTRW